MFFRKKHDQKELRELALMQDKYKESSIRSLYSELDSVLFAQTSIIEKNYVLELVQSLLDYCKDCKEKEITIDDTTKLVYDKESGKVNLKSI